MREKKSFQLHQYFFQSVLKLPSILRCINCSFQTISHMQIYCQRKFILFKSQSKLWNPTITKRYLQAQNLRLYFDDPPFDCQYLQKNILPNPKKLYCLKRDVLSAICQILCLKTKLKHNYKHVSFKQLKKWNRGFLFRF